MAAKLKKRALADYHTSATQLHEETTSSDAGVKENKRLKLTLHGGHLTPSGSRAGLHQRGASRSLSSSYSESASFSSCLTESAFPLEKLTKSKDISNLLLGVASKVKLKQLNVNQIRELVNKLSEMLNKPCSDSGICDKSESDRVNDTTTGGAFTVDIKMQIYISLSNLVSNYLFLQKIQEPKGENLLEKYKTFNENDETQLVSATLRTLLRERCDNWVNQLSVERSSKVKVAILTLLSNWFEGNERLHQSGGHEALWFHLKACLSDLNHLVKTNALRVLGRGIIAISSTDRSLGPDILTLVGRYTNSQDPRVRNAAFEALLEIHQQEYKLDVILYKDFCKALDDDYEGVRRVALSLVYVMSCAYPEHLIKVSRHNLNNRQHQDNSKAQTLGGVEPGGDVSREVRLVDDAFGKICNGVNDLSVQVREASMRLIGNFADSATTGTGRNGVSQMFLEQTLDKKLMSNMRTKRSAHEREAKMVSAGEWSSGKTWADDAPREEVDADDVSVMSFGACGAFIHGLEDEFMCVRLEAIESLTRLSIQNAVLASTALDFLVDMFNDEIELVRLKAIDSLTRIAKHISLQVHQLETIMSALDDFSMVVRERLHLMLQSSTIATKDGLQNVILKLLENIKRYPQDKRSILLTFKWLGLKHAELALPLVTQLLEIHPFFDTAEPDVEDPCYLCILVLVFNAAHNSPTLRPLLDHHTKRHFNYLVHTYPHLAKKPTLLHHPSMTSIIKSCGIGKSTSVAKSDDHDNGSRNTIRFLHQILDNVRSSVYGIPSLGLDGKIKILHRAQTDMERLGSIEPTVADAASFASLFIQAQYTILKCLSCRFWTNPTAMHTQQGEIVQNGIIELFRLCTQLQGRFVFSLDPNVGGGNREMVSNKNRHGTSRTNKFQQIRQIHMLKLKAMALHLVFLVRASNKSALTPTEFFLKEVEQVNRMFPTIMEEEEVGNLEIIPSNGGDVPEGFFLSELLRKLSEIPGGSEGRKPGVLARILQPLLISNSLEPLSIKNISEVSMTKAIMYEPAGSNETPLKYTAGLVLAVPVDCDLLNVGDISLVKVAIKTPDQKVSLVTPKASDFCAQEEPGSYRLRTNALMSHNVWSEALHVEISIVLDFNKDAMRSSDIRQIIPGPKKLHQRSASEIEIHDSVFRLVHICESVKVYVLPKPVKRGI